MKSFGRRWNSVEQEVMVALLAEGVNLNRWKIEKVPKGLRTKMTDKIKKDKEPNEPKTK